MKIKNLSNDTLAIFTGLHVPANATVPVAIDMQQKVKDSPLVAAYVKDKLLEIVTNEAPKAAARPVEAPAQTDVKKA